MKTWLKNHLGEKISCNLMDESKEFAAVFVHGFKGKKDTELFINLEHYFTDIGISVLRFDFSGCGESEGNYSESTIDKQSKELNKILKSIKYKKIILVGHSMGCTVSLISSKEDKRIIGIILINPLVFPYITFSDSLIKFSPFVLLSKFDVEKISKKSRIIRERRERIETILKREVMSPLMLEEFKKMNIICLAKTIKIPALIIHGKKDELIPESHGEYLNFNMKNSKFMLIDSDHGANSPKDTAIIGKHCQVFASKLKEKFLK
jgi:hypothetical protein